MLAAESEPRVLNKFIVVPRSPKCKWSINDFELLHKLGGGQYGDVFLASVKHCNFICAIKRLSLSKLSHYSIVNQLRREIEIAFHSRHKYLLRTYGYFYDAENMYLILEPCSNGMLFSELSKVKKYPPTTAARYVAQLAEALLYLHQHHILHRDIKPENILLDHHRNIKLADFGWSVHDPLNRRKTSCGTIEYFPPEIVRRQAYDCSADLWCLGIFCFELLVGSTPFVSKESGQIYSRIIAGKYNIPDTVPSEAKELISSLLQKDGSKRLPLQKVLTHPFLMTYYYLPNNLQPPQGKRPREE